MESGERDGGKLQSWLCRWKGARACGYYREPAQMRLQPPQGVCHSTQPARSADLRAGLMEPAGLWAFVTGATSTPTLHAEGQSFRQMGSHVLLRMLHHSSWRLS